MAFKMTPKSPVLMATGKFGSPTKNMNKGYGPAKTSSPAKQTKEGESISNTRGSDSSELTKKGATKPLTALQQAQKEANAAQMNNKVAQIKRNTAGTKKENARLRKRTARDNSGAERKNKNAAKTQARVDEREKSGKTRVGKVVAKIKKAVSPAKQAMQSGSSMTAAQKKAMKDKSVFGPGGKKVAKPPKNKKSLDKTGLTAGKDMTAAQKAKLKKYGKS